jgi:uncharacterized membrane protein YcaP (DUF421 family)
LDFHELGLTALRAVAVYVLMLAVIRLTGKRTIGNFSAFDLLVALMLGEVVDEIIYGDVTFAQGFVAIVVVAALKSMTAWLNYRYERLDKILEGEPMLIVKDGEFQPEGMRAELMNENDVLAALRLAGVEDMSEVRLAFVEPDGEISVVRQAWAETVRKRDIGPGRPAQDTSRRRATFPEVA